MKMRQLIIASMLAVGAVTATAPTQARVNVEIAIAPPAPLYEPVPAPRHGYVWAPGYWNWNGHKHVWSKGHWMRERHGEHWVAQNWHRQGDRWSFQDGRWERDHR